VASSKKTRSLILGGGFAGLHAAMHLDETLARDPETEITLVNRDNLGAGATRASGIRTTADQQKFIHCIAGAQDSRGTDVGQGLHLSSPFRRFSAFGNQ
jgi:glycine/D-amino acid oxidase-like deaminating enzyme